MTAVLKSLATFARDLTSKKNRSYAIVLTLVPTEPDVANVGAAAVAVALWLVAP